MFIEYEGLKDKKSLESRNLTLIEEFIEKRARGAMNDTEFDEIIDVLSDEKAKSDNIKKSEWKKEIGWDTFFRWLYFVRISAATVGKFSVSTIE